MKMKTRLLLAASVFFMLAGLIGCGIPTLFHVTTNFSFNSNKKEVAVTVNDPNNVLSLITPGKDPSILFAYVIASHEQDNDAKYGIPKLFNSTYRKGYHGRPIGRGDSEILTYGEDDPKLKLYLFSNESGSIFSAPSYHATANVATSPNVRFAFEEKETAPGSEKYFIEITQIPPVTYAFNQDLANIAQLFNVDGKPFEVEGNVQYLHLYMALNSSEGTFSNTYWSDLFYITSIDLAPPSQQP